MRELTLSRIGAIRAEVTVNYQNAIESYATREAYKADVEKKNASLAYLLQRASEALVKAFPEANEDPKAKKKPVKK